MSVVEMLATHPDKLQARISTTLVHGEKRRNFSRSLTMGVKAFMSRLPGSGRDVQEPSSRSAPGGPTSQALAFQYVPSPCACSVAELQVTPCWCGCVAVGLCVLSEQYASERITKKLREILQRMRRRREREARHAEEAKLEARSRQQQLYHSGAIDSPQRPLEAHRMRPLSSLSRHQLGADSHHGGPVPGQGVLAEPNGQQGGPPPPREMPGPPPLPPLPASPPPPHPTPDDIGLGEEAGSVTVSVVSDSPSLDESGSQLDEIDMVRTTRVRRAKGKQKKSMRYAQLQRALRGATATSAMRTGADHPSAPALGEREPVDMPDRDNHDASTSSPRTDDE